MKKNTAQEGRRRYEDYWAKQMAGPEFRGHLQRRGCEERALASVCRGRQEGAGLTQAELAQRLGVSQAQVARIEKCGYDAYTLNTLRKYVAALGDGFSVEVKIHSSKKSGTSVAKRKT